MFQMLKVLVLTRVDESDRTGLLLEKLYQLSTVKADCLLVSAERVVILFRVARCLWINNSFIIYFNINQMSEPWLVSILAVAIVCKSSHFAYADRPAGLGTSP